MLISPEAGSTRMSAFASGPWFRRTAASMPALTSSMTSLLSIAFSRVSCPKASRISIAISLVTPVRSFLPSDVEPGARDLVVGECPALLPVPDGDPEPPLCVLHPFQRSHVLLAAVPLDVQAHVYLVADEPLEVLSSRERPVDPGARYFEDVPIRHRARALELRLQQPREPGALVEGDPPIRVHVGTHDRTAVRSGDLQVDQLGARLLDDRLDDGDQAAGV